MRKHLIWLALCAGFGLSACTILETSRQAAASKACADWRWIGIKAESESECPKFPMWKGRPLFDPKLRQIGQRKQDFEPSTAEAAIKELNRFCVYESENDEVRELPRSAKLKKADKDCAVISRTADSDPTREDLEKASKLLLSQAGAAPLQINNHHGVRLAFLDTQPTGWGAATAPGNSHHGYTLTHIARHLVCSPAIGNRCAAQITTRLALPIIKFNGKSQKKTRIDLVRGGYIGTQGDLAEAILREVDEWREKRSQGHLVLNLSIGWDGQLFDELKTKRIDELRAGTQAVYEALQYAAKFDVLVLAAAGNRKGCDGPRTGPLLPAAWEGIKADPSQGAPLLYAVGGVRSDNNPLLNARDEGMPRRAAYGEVAGVTSWDPDRYTAFYTGSSVATAVVSSIAAVVWDSFPDLKSHQVMKILEDSGDELPFPADFWFGGGTAPIARKPSLCTALERACATLAPAGPCPLQAECVPRTLGDPAALRWASALSVPSTGKSCHAWLHPQPEDPPCLNCTEPPPK